MIQNATKETEYASSAAHDTELKKDVAIKKVNKVFERKILAKRTLRELKLLRHFLDHENVLLHYCSDPRPHH